MPNTLASAARRRNVLGLKHLDAFAGGPKSAMQDFLIWLSKRDVVYHEDDFTANAIDTTHWTTNAGSGGTAFATPGTQALGGTLAGATGTDGTASNRVVNMYGAPIWSGAADAGCEFRLKVGASAANIEWGVGFIDSHTTLTTPIVLLSDIDTPAFGAGIGDAALVYQDTAETLATAALATLGSGAVNAGATDALGTFTPTAATYFTVRIQLHGTTAWAAIEDANGGFTEVTRAAAVASATLLRLFVVISGPTNTTKTWTIDRIARWGLRAA